ncbi:hypothetical protein [Thioalkalivibrio sp. AKL19]|uniref:hypothetical protein n=1 Tax=Thioalkalivibrio sp. AKL19 TaxID=1266914 RepID=UPI00042337B6|nr:hypothetical protein [Thioalkalivibrio sp. AKL19]
MLRGNFSGRTAWRWLMLGALPLLFLAGCGGSVEPPPMMEARGDQCVEPLDVIRKDHGKLLMHERDDAVIRAVRNPDHSFVGCIDCHVATEARHTQPETHFCASCHSFNAVRMDCFECHRDRPEAEHLHTLNPHAPGVDFAWAPNHRGLAASLAEVDLLPPPEAPKP